jgi:protocatechuate 3,4-dioxygenase beta subunit
MRRAGAAFVVLIAAWLFAPASVFAQGTITGNVRDTSGAILPGVTVEVSSPALIEKVRSAVTDAEGQYRIVDLRGGTYTVTFHAARLQHHQT